MRITNMLEQMKTSEYWLSSGGSGMALRQSRFGGIDAPHSSNGSLVRSSISV